ncbi:MAG: hypothetical protein WA781_18990, partial [Pseudolabrys sp.]
GDIKCRLFEGWLAKPVTLKSFRRITEIIEGRRGGKKAADGGHRVRVPGSVASCFSASENVSTISKETSLIERIRGRLG